jgi:redox-sensitive bicupin YhaK (pirin superfamily)
MVGVDISSDGPVVLPLDPAFEHAIVGLSGEVAIDRVSVHADQMAYLGTGHSEQTVECEPGSRFLLLGGAPFEEEILMWWNFVARTRTELEMAYRDWSNGHERFGAVESTMPRIEAPRPYWMT